MLILRYDPLDGKVMPDGRLFDQVNGVIGLYNEQKKLTNVFDYTYTFGSEMFLTAFRVALMEGKFDNTQVEASYMENGAETRIPITKQGRLLYWPPGFCDKNEEMLSALIGWDWNQDEKSKGN